MSELVLKNKSASPKKFKLTHQTKDKLMGLLFVSPWIIGFLIFGLYPIVYSLILSFNKVEITATGLELTFRGFEHFTYAFTGLMQGAPEGTKPGVSLLPKLEEFLKDSLFMLLIINVFSLLFAVLLNSNIKGKGFFRTIFFLPVVVISGPVMAELLNRGIITMPNIGDFQIVNIIGAVFGQELKLFIAETFADLIYMFWFSGVQLIVYLTMLQKIDKSMYEAANIDGASAWESFWKITLPALKPAILINLVYTLIVLATFDNNSVIVYIKDVMFPKGKDFIDNYGYATAVAWIYFLVLLIIVVIIVVALYGFSRRKDRRFTSAEVYAYNKTRYQTQTGFFYQNKTLKKIRKKLFGQNFSDGLLVKIFMYTILGVMSFAFLYPFIYMLLKSIQSPEDVLNPAINLLPTGFYVGNWVKAFQAIGFFKSLGTSTLYAGIPTILQVVSCAIVGYGLAKFTFPGKKIVFGLVVFAFLIPPQILMIPTYIMYKEMNLLGSILTFVLPAMLGQGLKSTIFIMLFFQFFNMLPRELDEAAEIDGATKVGVFLRIAVPLSVPMFIVAIIFSFVWYWNETYLTALYMPDVKTLPMQLQSFAENYKNLINSMPDANMNSVQDSINDSIYMAGIIITISPLLLFYFVLQHWFVEGIDKAGLTGQ